jgi:metacaspase-1
MKNIDVTRLTPQKLKSEFKNKRAMQFESARTSTTPKQPEPKKDSAQQKYQEERAAKQLQRERILKAKEEKEKARILNLLKPKISKIPPPQVPHSPRISQPTATIKRALIIGINYTKSKHELFGCIPDAQNMKSMLQTMYNFDKNDIVLLIDDNVYSDLQPTRENILNQIKLHVKATNPGDTLVIHYSGHGMQIRSNDDDEDYNPDTPGMSDALCPLGFDNQPGRQGLIVDDDLRDLLIPLPATATLRVFFDCCHSGSALNFPYIYREGTLKKEQSPFKQSENFLLISGCRDHQTSADAYIDDKYSGALTWAIRTTLQNSVKIKTTWLELLLVLRHALATAGYSQSPCSPSPPPTSVTN